MSEGSRGDGAVIGREIARFIGDTFAKGNRAGAIRENTRLMGGPLLDSIAVLELMVHLEETYGVTIAAEEITPDNFGTLGSMTRFIAGRADRK
ncbi:MAG TPA: phosphopantetheine-binding protein [Candidatus Polarisedimenticolia bacterium]|jgi:acyl carrier protein